MSDATAKPSHDRLECTLPKIEYKAPQPIIGDYDGIPVYSDTYYFPEKGRFLPEALAERLIQYLTDHILWDMEPGYTKFDTERRALLDKMSKVDNAK